jgi:hypothetical protein
MRGPFQLVAYEPDEHELQIACVKMLRTLLLPDVCWTAIDHGHSIDRTPSWRDPRVSVGFLEMQKRRARGVIDGIWDLWFWRVGITHVIELKVGDNDLSSAQEEFGERLILAGVRHLKVCWTQDQVFDAVCGWGLTRVANQPP